MITRLIPSSLLALLTSFLLVGCQPPPEAEEDAVETEVAVQTGKVIRCDLRTKVDVYGRVEGEPAGGGKPGGAARLSAPASGIVMAVPVKEGEHVAAGAVIVKLDDRLALAQAEKARHAVEFAEQQLARQDKLMAVEGTSEKSRQEAAQQLAAAKSELAAAQAQLALVQLTSPTAGVVARINVQPGQAVDSNVIVAEVIDPERLIVTANVPAREAASLKTGQQAEIFTDLSSSQANKGQVLYIEPQVSVTTDTSLVRVSLPTETGFRLGQFVHLRIITEERAGKLAVPREAVYTDHDGQSTLSLVEGDKAIQKNVKTGLRDGDLVEVEGEGLKEGAVVVTLGSYALPKETKVRILKAEDKGMGTKE